MASPSMRVYERPLGHLTTIHKNFTEVICYLHRHIFPQNMKWSCVHSWPGSSQQSAPNCSMRPRLHCLHIKSLLSQFSKFHNITAAINFQFSSLHLTAFFSRIPLTGDSLGAHNDHVGAIRNVQSACQLKAAILSFHMAFLRTCLQHSLLTILRPHQTTHAVALETSR